MDSIFPNCHALFFDAIFFISTFAFWGEKLPYLLKFARVTHLSVTFFCQPMIFLVQIFIPSMMWIKDCNTLLPFGIFTNSESIILGSLSTRGLSNSGSSSSQWPSFWDPIDSELSLWDFYLFKGFPIRNLHQLGSHHFGIFIDSETITLGLHWLGEHHFGIVIDS